MNDQFNLTECTLEYQGDIALNIEKWTFSRSLVCSVLVFWVRASSISVGLKFPTQSRMTLGSRSPAPTSHCQDFLCVDILCRVTQTSSIWTWYLVARKKKWFHSPRRKSRPFKFNFKRKGPYRYRATQSMKLCFHLRLFLAWGIPQCTSLESTACFRS